MGLVCEFEVFIFQTPFNPRPPPSKLPKPRGDVGVEYVLSTPLRVVRGD